eukprot:223852-Pelagomonas_calceolata.AAC.4
MWMLLTTHHTSWSDTNHNSYRQLFTLEMKIVLLACALRVEQEDASLHSDPGSYGMHELSTLHWYMRLICSR